MNTVAPPPAIDPVSAEIAETSRVEDWSDCQSPPNREHAVAAAQVAALTRVRRPAVRTRRRHHVIRTPQRPRRGHGQRQERVVPGPFYCDHLGQVPEVKVSFLSFAPRRHPRCAQHQEAPLTETGLHGAQRLGDCVDVL